MLPKDPPVASTWRVAAYTQWEQLSDELVRLDSGKQRTPDYEIATKRLAEAKDAIAAPYSWRWPKLFYSGAQIERTWSCLHEAGRALLLLLEPDALLARIPLIRAPVTLYVDPSDPERAPALRDLNKIEKRRTATAADRERLRAIRAYADGQSDLFQRDVRSFPNLLLVFSLLLGLLLCVVAIVHALDSSLISLCAGNDPALKGDLCPNGGAHPGRFDVAEVELVGALGGLLAAIIRLAKSRRLPGPYGLAVAQSALKIVSGATTAFVGVLLLQGGLLAGLARQPGSSVLAYAAFFGLAQQALTVLVDRRVGDLAGAPAAKRKPGATTSSSATP